MPKVPWAVRCRAHHKYGGKPCRAWAMRGGYVCRMHGGSLVRTRAKALERLVTTTLERWALETGSLEPTGSMWKRRQWLDHPR
jgi:hypothetical protein